MADHAVVPTQKQNETQAENRSLKVNAMALGGVLSAIAASSCCILPLILVGLGIGGAWASRLGVLEPYRPIFTGVTLIFLGVAHYRVYRQSKAVCADEAACARPLPNRIAKVALWTATVVSTAVLAFPYVIPLFLG
jgi:mercuric ion transport protein